MTNRCDICIEEECKGKRNCDCSNCKNIGSCVKVLHPTIRITTKCTQACPHCCFECSPKSTDMMTVKGARQTAKFLRNNNIKHINLMGGEICCNPNWRKIVTILLAEVVHCRLVTNSDTIVEDGAAKFLSGFKNLKVSVSYDKWHNNDNVARAEELLTEFGIPFNVATEEQTKDGSVVPIGRGEFFDSVYSMFACYCQNPDHRYAFLIDEVGRIFKCGFGVWNYAEIGEYIDGGFAERFKEFCQAFFSAFVSNCSWCKRASDKYTHKKTKAG